MRKRERERERDVKKLFDRCRLDRNHRNDAFFSMSGRAKAKDFFGNNFDAYISIYYERAMTVAAADGSVCR